VGECEHLPAVLRLVSPKARLTARPPVRGKRFHTRGGPTNPCMPRAGSTTPLQGLVCIARHVMGCRFTQETRVYNAYL
jgi:hypothetical protein